jgi:pimeloyl-ACP methyl ester carboxylesterase
MDRNQELLAALRNAKIRQPSLFAAGDEDVVITMYRPFFDLLEQTMPGLTQKRLIPGVGHWVQQEAPEEVNGLLVDFLQRQQQP